MGKASLNKVLDRLREIGDDLQEVMDYSGIAPASSHHRTAVFVRLPYPGIVQENEEVMERLARFLGSLNQPDTIKADLYTCIGRHVLPGYQPHTELTADGDFDPDSLHKIVDQPYVLQIVVDVIQPAALEATLNALK